MALFRKKKKTSKEREPASWEAKLDRTQRKLAWNLLRAQLSKETIYLITNDPELQRRHGEKLIAEKISGIRRDHIQKNKSSS